jgi:aminoglycoside phosphotransferase (APT) family kinase protein
MTLSEAAAADLASGLLGLDRCRAWRFGAGKFSEVFAVTTGRSGEEYVLRVAPPDSVRQLFYEYRMMRQEPAIHQRLLAETKVPVPPILAVDFTREHLDRDFLIMSRLPGIPLSEAALSCGAQASALRQWGHWVRQIHGILATGGRFGYLGEHQCMTPQATWPEAFAVMYRKLLDDIVVCGVYDRPAADAAMALLEQHLPVFDACTTSHLCHGDLWVTNLLVDADGDVTGLLDFDRACWGDVEWDLAIAEYCNITREPFWEGYGGHVETHTGEAAVRRFFYLLYEHQKYIVISMSTRRNSPTGARRYATESLNAMAAFRQTGNPVFP